MLRSVGMENSEGPSDVAASQYRLTQPISLAGPTEADIQSTLELGKVCTMAFEIQAAVAQNGGVESSPCCFGSRKQPLAACISPMRSHPDIPSNFHNSDAIRAPLSSTKNQLALIEGHV
ncbi:hypothetical protein FF1_046454 [Malus domestica]